MVAVDSVGAGVWREFIATFSSADLLDAGARERAMRELGLRTIRFNFRGAGESEGEAEPPRWRSSAFLAVSTADAATVSGLPS